NGLEQLDVLGEVGFGDMARILMRRRSNAGLMRELRDRFTFKVRMMSAIRNPDAFWAVVTEDGLAWARQPAAFVIAASYTFNLPLLVENQTGAALRVRAEFQGTTAKSDFADAEGHGEVVTGGGRQQIRNARMSVSARKIVEEVLRRVA